MILTRGDKVWFVPCREYPDGIIKTVRAIAAYAQESFEMHSRIEWTDGHVSTLSEIGNGRVIKIDDDFIRQLWKIKNQAR